MESEITKYKQLSHNLDDFSAPVSKMLCFGMDESTDSNCSDSKLKIETDTKVKTKLKKAISPKNIHRLPAMMPTVPNPYLVRIPCKYLPYSCSFESEGKKVAPSINEIPSLPIAPTNVPSYPRKKPTPRPTLRLSYYANSIVLTWHMTHKPSKFYAKTVYFDLYMHEVPKYKAYSCSWKKIRELTVKDLPQKFKIVELRGGYTYFFSLCAVDADSCCGEFSVPKGITLLPC